MTPESVHAGAEIEEIKQETRSARGSGRLFDFGNLEWVGSCCPREKLRREVADLAGRVTSAFLRLVRARASIRLSLGKQNTPKEVDYALSLVPETVARLRELSPAYNKTAAEGDHLR